MIIALGEIETKNLIDDLIQIALGENELNEKNSELGKLKHSDGWGLAYLDDNGKWNTYKSIKPIYEDEMVVHFHNLKTKAIILHARKATKGEKSIENTQPLYYHSEKGEFLFAHNGNIFDEFHSENNLLDGTSDTVMWFNKLLDNLENNKKKEMYPFNNYTSANFFFITPDRIIVGENYKNFPKYHTMKLFEENKTRIISSEVLPCFKGKEWRNIKNNSLMELDYAHLL